MAVLGRYHRTDYIHINLDHILLSKRRFFQLEASKAHTTFIKKEYQVLKLRDKKINSSLIFIQIIKHLMETIFIKKILPFKINILKSQNKLRQIMIKIILINKILCKMETKN